MNVFSGKFFSSMEGQILDQNYKFFLERFLISNSTLFVRCILYEFVGFSSPSLSPVTAGVFHRQSQYGGNFFQSNLNCLKAAYLLLLEHVREVTCLVLHLEKIQN